MGFHFRLIFQAIDGAKGMEFLHSHKPSIIHRDLKSHNLLVDENDLVKVRRLVILLLVYFRFSLSNFSQHLNQ